MDGMISSNTSDMIKICKKSQKKNSMIKSLSLLKNPRIKIGGGLSEISSTKEIFVLMTNSWNS